MSLKTVRIHARDGSVLYEGKAASKKQFIQILVGEDQSLANADLRGQDLSHLDLTGVDFRGADLTGAVMRGTIVDDGHFYAAVMNGVRAEGMMARRADFSRIDAFVMPGDEITWTDGRSGEGQPATFAGATLTHSTFEGAELEGAIFDDCAMSGASFNAVTAKNCSFRRARMLNVDHRNARYVTSNFDEADLGASRSLTRRIPERTLPDRTGGCIAIGNSFSKTRFDQTVPALKADRAIRGFASAIAWTGTTAALMAATAMLPGDPEEQLMGYLKEGGAFVAVVGVVALLKERLEDYVKDLSTEGLLHAQLAIRRGVAEVARRGGNVVRTVAAFCFGHSAKALKRALSATEGFATRNGSGPLFRQVLTGSVDVILADRAHMAKALEQVSAAKLREDPSEADVTIIRTGGSDSAPTAMTFLAGGGSIAIWTREGRIARTMVWPAGTNAAPPTALDRRMPKRDAELTRQAFEQAILSDHLPEAQLTYDARSHQLRAGGDGSIVVTARRTQLPDNPLGPVVIRPNGEMLDAARARKIAIAEDDAEAEIEHLERARLAP